jgi:glutamate racemase
MDELVSEVSPHVVITDSGLGGISVCAEIEHGLRRKRLGARITYVNALPQNGLGYNDLRDMSSRAAAFDLALDCMASLNPDLILIACNTLSVVYLHTGFSQRTRTAVSGIIEAGVDLFFESLGSDPASSILLFGTRTTIESGVHCARLSAKGIDPARITGVACHGLAGAVETDPGSEMVKNLIAQAAEQAAHSTFPGLRIYAGLCCTHYTFIKDELSTALQKATGKPVIALDPNGRLADAVLQSISVSGKGIYEPTVRVISKAELSVEKRRIVAGLISGVSEDTARALLDYTFAPHLF